MAEFIGMGSGLTHAGLADGETHTEIWVGGQVTISRSGTFTYYRFHTSSAAHRFRMLAQPRPEVRLVYVAQGKGIQVGCHGPAKVFSDGESDCSLVTEGCTQNIGIDGEGSCELFILVVGLPDFPLPNAGRPSYLNKFLRTDTCAWLLGGRGMVLGMRKVAVIQQLLHDKKPVYLQRAYTQLKLAELWVLFLEKADHFSNEGALARLRSEELERMQKVRDLLYNQPARSYSLVGLAHAVGTNEATLKKHFKAVYGTTVFGYLTARRMELAKALLLSKELKVAAVAQEVGYKYASHFTAAFRKHFGVLPNKLLRMVLPAFPVLGELETICAFLFAA
ncbi:AraC family transcriptional regulator [Parapedobacter sp. 10938]|uniref:AraC family transcriptional regulator n=1 Tax=Parapedobacter flavus TaxID=3110225 RepID=UPI002DBA6AD4|nr:AraC family transcriptional regulator [Parapedobacter sp. 10938]MEC3880525.1 AraC family transcriptional regulator [Parapedobacter sp. 10938]